MKFVHAADLHLDSPLSGLSKYEGAPVEQIRGATRRALENLVQLCLTERVELLVIAGDLYDGDWRDYSTGLFFNKQMSLLRAGDVKVVWIRGNHDAASKLTAHLALPDNVHELSHKKPESFLIEELGVAVHGQGFETRDVTRDLSERYPEPKRDLFNIGLLHTALEGRAGHAPYAPCRLTALVDRGYEYFALGHVHNREVLSEKPWVVFPGNLQGRHARETGPKGATLVSVESQQVRAVEHRALDDVRWHVAALDISAESTLDGVLERARHALGAAVSSSEGRLAAIRVRLEGASAAHELCAIHAERLTEEVRALTTDLPGDAWLEKVELATRPVTERALLRDREDAIGEMLRGFGSLLADDAALTELAAELAELKRKLPTELREGPEAIDLDSPAALRQLLCSIEETLVPTLRGSEDPGA
ncbi:MAG TPA: DNA repair exonuclease [Polyangiaceae bacterium]|jgi:exonuclease SbcD|nr:DNA repair exonuclease [Polyangiaceae bacterium]